MKLSFMIVLALSCIHVLIIIFIIKTNIRGEQFTIYINPKDYLMLVSLKNVSGKYVLRAVS